MLDALMGLKPGEIPSGEFISCFLFGKLHDHAVTC